MWTMLYLDQDNQAYLFDSDLEAAQNRATDDGYNSAYFVWWNEDIGWYGLRYSNDWTPVFERGRI